MKVESLAPVRSPPGQPFNTKGQASECQGVNPSSLCNTEVRAQADAYLSYATGNDGNAGTRGPTAGNSGDSGAHNWSVPALRSRPFEIKPIPLRTGRITYRVATFPRL